MHDGKPLLNQCKAFLKRQTSYIKGKSFLGLMAEPNNGALTLNTLKVSDSKGNPDGPNAVFVCVADRWVLTVHPLKLQTIPSHSSTLFMFFTPFTLSLSFFMCEGYEAKRISRLSNRTASNYSNSITEMS